MGLNKNIFYTEIGLSIIFFLLFFVFLKMSASQVKTPRTECTLISLATAGLTVTSCYSCLSSYYCFKGPPAGCNNIQGAERYRILLYKLKPFLLSVGSHLQSSSSNTVNMEVWDFSLNWNDSSTIYGSHYNLYILTHKSWFSLFWMTFFFSWKPASMVVWHLVGNTRHHPKTYKMLCTSTKRKLHDFFYECWDPA